MAVLENRIGNPEKGKAVTDIVFIRMHHSLEEEFGYLSKFGCIEISSGICCLAAVARKYGYNAEIIDALPLKIDNEGLARLMAEKKPKYIGISACTMDINAALDFADRVKRAGLGAVIIVGGPHITAVPIETMQQCRSFDIGVVGEGENTILELLNALAAEDFKSFSDIAGIVYREKEKIIVTKPRTFINDLDTLPMPAWDMLPDLKTHYFAPAWTGHFGQTATVITSRGCPFQCIYCDRKVFGNTVRYHSAPYVLDMLKTLHHKYGISHFRIGDDNFMMQRKRLYEICDLLIKERMKITWSCLARADSIDPGILAKMKEAGCWSIAFGVETGSQKIHDIEKKNVRLDQIAKAVAMTRKIGIKTISFNIIGHPMETIETIKDTINFNKRIKVDDFKTQFMVPFPGTELYQNAEKYGTLDKDWNKMVYFTEPIFIPYGLNKEDMIKWNKKGFASFYMQPRIIWAYMMRMRSLAEIKMMIIGAFTILAWKIGEITQNDRKKTRSLNRAI